MKKFSLVIALTVMMFAGAQAQILKPVKWEFGAKKLNDTEAVVFMKAKMDAGWHIYSLNLPDGGPIKTSFAFEPSKDFTLVGKTAQPEPKSKFEAVFDMDVTYFDKEVVFQQKIKLTKGQTVVKGVVEFMACDAEQCLPPDELAFTVPIK